MNTDDFEVTWRDTAEVIHILECESEAYTATIKGLKPWEYRYNDRGFLAGDLIELVETHGVRKQLFSISYVEPVGPLGYCVMTLGAP